MALGVDLGNYLDTLLFNFFFQLDNNGPVFVTLKPFMVEGHAVSHFKALVIFYQEPEDQDCFSFFSICNTRLKMGVFTVF